MLPQVLYILQEAETAVSLEDLIFRVEKLCEGKWASKDDGSLSLGVLHALDKGMQFGFIFGDRKQRMYKLGVNYSRFENYNFSNKLRVLSEDIALHGLRKTLSNAENIFQSDSSDDSMEYVDSAAYDTDDEHTPTPKKKLIRKARKISKQSKKRVFAAGSTPVKLPGKSKYNKNNKVVMVNTRGGSLLLASYSRQVQEFNMSDSEKIIQVQLSNIERNYRKLQSQYNWKPMSETFEKFREKFPLQYDDKAGLIHRTDRLNYIKSSQPKLAQEVRIPLKRYGSSDETRSITEPAESFRFGQICNKPVDRPKGVIYTNAKGFARLVDPYLTTTMKDIVPHVKHQHDTVTFWNWTGREERKRVPKPTNALQPRMVLPVFKRKLNQGFVSEMRANYVKPVELEFRLDPTVTRPIALDPTDHTETATESSMYGGTKNCAMILKQRRYE